MPAPSTSLSLPSHEEPLVRGSSTLLGGPVGRHARFGHWFWSPLRVVLLLTMFTFLLGFAQKAPCRDGGYGEHNFYAYSRLCYSDVYALYFAEGLNEDKTPYVDHPVEYPVVIGGIMKLASEATDLADDALGPFDNKAGRFYDITAILLGICALVMAATSVGLAGHRRRWDGALVALAPGLMMHGTTNWDLPAAALAGVGLFAWSRKQPELAGVFLGFAVATKLYPALFFLPLLVLCLRSRQAVPWLRASVAGVATWLVVNVPVAMTAGHFVKDENGNYVKVASGGLNGWARFFEGNRERGADWDSLHFLIERVMRGLTGDEGWSIPTEGGLRTLNNIVAVSTVAAVLAICALCWFAPRRPRLGQVVFLVVAAFLLVNKVNSPQFTIWLIPLAVMARPRWGAFLTWQVAELFVVFTRFYFFINISPDSGGKGLPVEWFHAAILLRTAALVALMGLVVREILRPETDTVRAGGVDDPAGGFLDGAPDVRDRSAPAPGYVPVRV